MTAPVVPFSPSLSRLSYHPTGAFPDHPRPQVSRVLSSSNLPGEPSPRRVLWLELFPPSPCERRDREGQCHRRRKHGTFFSSGFPGDHPGNLQEPRCDLTRTDCQAGAA